MLEVSKITVEGIDYLKIEVKKFSPEELMLITSIEGWFKANELNCYGLPYSKVEEFTAKTKDHMVVWKGTGDNMGALVKGIDTSDIPTDYIVEYTPKIPLRTHQIITFNLMMLRDTLLISDQEGVGSI